MKELKMVWIDKNAFNIIKQKQTDLLKNTGKNILIQDISTKAIIKGIDMINIDDIETEN